MLRSKGESNVFTVFVYFYANANCRETMGNITTLYVHVFTWCMKNNAMLTSAPFAWLLFEVDVELVNVGEIKLTLAFC